MTITQNYNRMITNMMDHVEKGTTDSAKDVFTVSAASYQDEAQWQREMDVLFLRRPIMVGVSHELATPGDYKTLSILGRPLLIVRQRDGSVKTFLNVCPHRAMLIATDNYGNKGVFTCPYHGWSFGCDGKLRAVAEAHKFGEIDKSAHNLTELSCHERAGLIFAVLTPGEPADYAGDLGDVLADIGLLNLEQAHFCGTRDMVGANWKVAYDGYLEGYHFAAAHPDTIYPRTFSNIMEYDSYGPHTLIGFPQRSILELRNEDPDKLYQFENKGYDFIRTIFPNVSIFVAPEITQIAQIIPGPTPAQNKTVLYFLYREEMTEGKREELEEMIDWIWKVVEEEDYGIGLKVQQGLEAGAYKNIVFGKNEKANQFFHQWVAYLTSASGEQREPRM